MLKERTTKEVARELGVEPDVLRKWKYRGLLLQAPPGVAGQGRSVECRWSEAAFQEAKAHAEADIPRRRRS